MQETKNKSHPKTATEYQPSKFFWGTIITLLVVTLFLIQSKILDLSISSSEALLVILLGLIFLLVIFGLVGPKSLKRNMQKFQIWMMSSDAMIYWFNPYKLISKSVQWEKDPKARAKYLFPRYLRAVVLSSFLAMLLFILIFLFFWMFGDLFLNYY